MKDSKNTSAECAVVKERPILFSGAMVRAILAGRKTQTRRVGSLQSDHYVQLGVHEMGHATKGSVMVATYAAFPGRGTARWGIGECPYGVPGDRLWVRETHSIVGAPGLTSGESEVMVRTQYLDGQMRCATLTADELQKLRARNAWCLGDQTPGIFMFRSLSRITLEIVSVRVERLQEISEGDAMAEGIERDAAEFKNYNIKDKAFSWLGGVGAAVRSYSSLWESINGPESWALNPWVWVVEFKRL